MRVSAMSYGGWLTLGKGQKGDVAKELVKTSFEAGINTVRPFFRGARCKRVELTLSVS